EGEELVSNQSSELSHQAGAHGGVVFVASVGVPTGREGEDRVACLRGSASTLGGFILVSQAESGTLFHGTYTRSVPARSALGTAVRNLTCRKPGFFSGFGIKDTRYWWVRRYDKSSR